MAYGFQTACIVIVKQLLYLRLFTAQRARGIFSDRKRHEFRVQRTVNQELTDQRFPFFQNKLDRLRGLNQSNLPGHNSQDSCYVSARNKTRRRGLGKEAAQTGTSFFWKKDTGLPFKLENTSIDIRLPRKKRGVVHQVFGRKVV